jgi:glutamyl-tRNA reductase
MSIYMAGIDYTKANLDIRALFSFTKKNAVAAMERWKKLQGVYGCVIISTCNRMEVWASVDKEWDGSVFEELCKLKEVDPTQYEPYFVFREGTEAVDHLFHLTCGLKSMILAEDQIITQVKDALALARENYMTDNVMEVLFRKAITAGKKVKTDVTFSRANETAMDKAIEMLRNQEFAFSTKNCMVIGNGEMGKLAAQSLKKAGANVTVTVRQYRSGVVTIPMGCSRINYGERLDFLPTCDLVVSATASPNYTLTKEQVASVKLKDDVIFIDLAVPRDIESEVSGMSGVRLFTIDDFKVNETNEDMMSSMVLAESILADEMEDFYVWLQSRDVIPRIQEIKTDAVNDLYLRLHKILNKLPLESDEKKSLEKAINTAAGKVVTKMIFGLRDALEENEFLDCVEGLEKLYEE